MQFPKMCTVVCMLRPRMGNVKLSQQALAANTSVVTNVSERIFNALNCFAKRVSECLLRVDK